jgi:hypothetical protein
MKEGRTGYSSVAALAMARAQKRLAAKYKDKPLAKHAATLEQPALAAIKQGQQATLSARPRQERSDTLAGRNLFGRSSGVGITP